AQLAQWDANVVMTIEPATEQDAQAVAKIHVDAWRAAFVGIVPDDYLAALSVEQRFEMWRQAITDQAPELLVARLDGRVIGWVSFGPSRDKDAAADASEIWAIYLDPSHVGNGVGRALWLHARKRLIERGFKSAMLWVLSGNARAIRFYERAGFTVDAGPPQRFTLGGRELEELRYMTPL
ncbi:MAG: GNAT family N-acetyltransferase, partial [Burkholderiales bacterium]